MGGIGGYPALPIAGSPLKAYQRFLFWAAGAGRDMLQDCVEAEKFKYECLGALICLTATVASVSMFMAVWLTWQRDPWAPMLALPLALLWGILIFTIDRFMVSSLRADAAWSLRLWQALPRLILAVIIGVIISRPIEIKIFETEIMKIIESDLAQYRGSLDDESARVAQAAAEKRFEGSKRALENKIDSLEQREGMLTASYQRLLQELADLRLRAQAELDGGVGDREPGHGAVSKLKQRDLTNQEERVRNTEAELLEVRGDLDRSKDQLEELEGRIKEEAEGLATKRSADRNTLREIADRRGFLELNLALYRLAELPQLMPAVAAAESDDRRSGRETEIASVVSLTLWGITLLFITIEVLPILTKLMAPAGQYDEKMQSAPYAAQLLGMQEMVAVARARAAFLERYEHASSALYGHVFERLKADDGRTETVMGALWEHLRGGLDEMLTRLRGYQSPPARDRPELAETDRLVLVPASQTDELPRGGFRLGGRGLISAATTTLMFFVAYWYCLNQGIKFEGAISVAAGITSLAPPLLTAMLIRHSSSEK